MNKTTATRSHSLRRMMGKLFQFAARKIPFVPSKLRVRFQRLHGVNFTDWRSVFLGEDVYFDDIYPEDIYVGRNVRITAGVRILTHYFDTKFQPIPERPFRFYRGQVVIGDNVFVGVNTVIAKPITIGNGAVIGANSVVTHDIPANAIVVGSPAKVVGYRPAMSGVSQMGECKVEVV